MDQVEALRVSVDQLSADGKHLREQLGTLTSEMAQRTAVIDRRTTVMSRRTTVLAWLFAGGAVVLACALLAAYTVSLNNQAAIEKSNRQWCPMVGLLIPQPGQPHATTPRGLQLEQNARDLYTTFGCGIAK